MYKCATYFGTERNCIDTVFVKYTSINCCIDIVLVYEKLVVSWIDLFFIYFRVLKMNAVCYTICIVIMVALIPNLSRYGEFH